MELKMLKYAILLVFVINETHCFNLDVNNYIRHSGQDASMFGFSVALHQESNRSWVIIGSPKANTRQFQEGVIEGGAVYRCDISQDDRCQPIHFDSNGNTFNDKGEQIDTKSHQWFGATVSSAGIDGPLVACAPRYVYHQHQPKKFERIEPVGTCYIAKDNFREFSEYSPCRTMYWGYHRQGSCQAGMSAAVAKSGDRLFIGAPGSWYWQGQVYSINTDAKLPFKPPRYGQFGDGGQMYSYSLNNPKDKVYQTKESSSREDDSYMGYSSASGDFTGDGQQGVAVGMPRGGHLLGKVLIYSWNLTNTVNITGEQIGAYFGYSITSIDVDGDKLDDLIIGAPMFTPANNEGKYETGMVYIVYQTKERIKFRQVDTREGLNSKGRFGLSVAALGDVNQDGFGDFAVGAPYDGPNGRGAVYIYHGSRNGPLAKPSQVIHAEDITGAESMSTFGFSIAGGIDLDGNRYPDVVIGAYESNKAIVLKARPVVAMDASASFEAENKLISLESKNCTLRNGKQATCTRILSCLNYNGINVPSDIAFDVSWILDSKKSKTPRMFFVNDENKNVKNSSMRISRGRQQCRTETVYIAEGIRDKLTPLEVEMHYKIQRSESQYSSTSATQRSRAKLEPVIDENIGTVQRDSINIMKNCGPDNVCIPDLRLEVKTNEKYALGTNESLTVDVLIRNFGEDAFEASFYMNVPTGLNYQKTKRIGDTREGSFICSVPSAQTNNALKCDIGNPLPAGKHSNFRVYLEPSSVGGRTSETPVYEFYMEANSTNDEVEGGNVDNVVRKSVEIFVDSDISIGGSSLPNEFHYNISHYKSFENATLEGEIGPHVVHIYDIRNNGTSSIEEVEVLIFIPVETLDGRPLMYLMNQPETLGPVQCEIAHFVNIKNLQPDRSLDRKSYLDKNQLPKRQGGYGYSSWRRTSQSSEQGKRTNINTDEYSESAGDASFVHKQRGQDSSYYDASRSRSNFVSSETSNENSGSKAFGWSDGSRRQSANSESQNENRVRGSGARVESGSGWRQSEDGGSGSQSSFESSSRATGNNDRRTGAGRRVSTEYHETWNSSSVNGGPAVTHVSSSNRTYAHGNNGQVLVSEISTERVLVGSDPDRRWEANYRGGQGRESSSSARTQSSQSSSSSASRGSMTQEEYEHYEYNRKLQLEERERRIQENLRREEEQRLVEEHRRSEEQRRIERRRQEEERRLAEERRVQQSSSSVSSTSYQSNYDEGSSYGSQSRSRSENRGYSSNNAGSFDSNVDQDISHLSSRTHAEHESKAGRRRMFSQQDGESARDFVSGISTLEKVAQGGQGFQTVGLDLGIGSRRNTDDEINRQAASSGTFESNYRAGSSSSSSKGAAQSSHSSSSQHDSYGYDDDDYEENGEDIPPTYGNEASHSTHHQSSSYNYNSGPRTQQSYFHSSGDAKLQHYPKKREANDNNPCRATNCQALKCTVGPLDKSSSTNGALIAFRTRLVAETLNKLGGDENEVRLSTLAIGSITRLPYLAETSQIEKRSHEVFFTAIPDPIPKPDIVPLWIVVLAAIAGILILILLVYLLYKCGFFKRNRPQGSPHERQPLNRNGNYHGDEHL